MSKDTYIQEMKALSESDIWEQLDPEGKCKTKQVFSSSTIFTYAECPGRYYLEHVERAIPDSESLAAFGGIQIHSAIGKLHKTKKWKDWGDLFHQDWHEGLKSHEDSDIPWRNDETPDDEDKLYQDARIMLGNYVERNSAAKVVASEARACAVLQHPRTGTSYRFTGRLDQLREPEDIILHNQTPGVYVPSEGADLEIWDIKSGKIEPSATYLDRNKQFSIYGLLVKHGTFEIGEERVCFGRYPARSVWYQLRHLLPYKRATTKNGIRYKAGDLRGDPVRDVHRIEDDYLKAQADLFNIIRAIRFKLFWTAESDIGCRMCDYKTACTSGRYKKQLDVQDIVDMDDL